VFSAIQTSDDRFNHPFRLMGISDPDGHDTGFFGRIVVPTREQGIPGKDHVLNCNAKGIPEFSDPVGFVDARLGDVNGCRATQSHRKLGDKLFEECFDLLPLGEVRIPLLLFFRRSLLP
jgi:hypothetical protein